MWSSYYTDAEPESLFVVERGGAVAGYLFGCLDSRRAWNPAWIGARQAVTRLCLARLGTAGVIWRTVADVAIGRLVGRPPVETPFFDQRWPSHLHINLLPEARGSGAGRALVDAWFDRLRTAGSPGCHLETLAENIRAIGFFEAVGFTRFGEPQAVPGERSRDGMRLHRQVMVRSIA